VLVAALGAAIALVSHRRPETPERPSALTFVGGETCASCHAGETRRWAGSHQDRAMDVASEQSVFGDFALATINRDIGARRAAQDYAPLAAAAPWDPDAGRLQEQPVTRRMGERCEAGAGEE